MHAVEGAVIAAAGLGSRLGLGLPKCMLEIDGDTILSRLVHSLSRHVPRIHVVVGYREELIIEHCARHHRHVILVRNPEFRSTNTAQSMAAGARGLAGKVLFMDGDIVLSPSSLATFMQAAERSAVLLGITDAKTDQAVFVETEPAPGEPGEIVVRGFTRESPQPFEWANLFVGPAGLLDDTPGYIYESLTSQLPLPACHIALAEVDTPNDFEVAKRFTREMA